MIDDDVREMLDRVVPESDECGDWHRVMVDANTSLPSSRLRRRRFARVSVVAVAAATAISVLVVTPALGLRGTLAKLTGSAPPVELSAQAEADMQELADAGPNDIRCSDDSAILRCTAVPGQEALDALRNGETLYGRHVYSDVSRAADTGIPVFEADELFCDPPGADGIMLCRAAGEVQPTVSPGQKMLATYRRYHVTFGPSGNTIGRQGERTVPLVTDHD
jgi:hypothetical protein